MTPFDRPTPLIQDTPPRDMPGAPFIDVSFPSNLDAKFNTLNDVLEKMTRAGLIRSETDRLQVRLVLDEGLVNAVKHGNHEDPNKTVRLIIWQEPDRWRCRIEDQGNGFRIDDIPNPSDPDNMFLDHGRGVAYMHAFFDEVQYYCGGRILELARRYARSESMETADE